MNTNREQQLIRQRNAALAARAAEKLVRQQLAAQSRQAQQLLDDLDVPPGALIDRIYYVGGLQRGHRQF